MIKSNRISHAVHSRFPNAELARLYYLKQNLWLEETHDFAPHNTRLAEGGCCDAINEPEYQLMARHWGERFKFGGLAGYCHGGRTGMAAVSQHVPDADGKKNLLVLAGPHIGYYNGKWGSASRQGQRGITPTCGSINAVLNAGYEAVSAAREDILDKQQYTVGRLLLPYLKECAEEGRQTDSVSATIFLMLIVDAHLSVLLEDLTDSFEGKIALITGITINTAEGNYFSQSRREVLGD